ncbi:MAG: EamA family transporter [Thermoanaerobaculia bacterium]
MWPQALARDHSLSSDAVQDLPVGRLVIPARLVTYAALALLILIWGTTWAAIRVGLEGIPPFAGVALRFAIAAVVLLAAARHLGVRLDTGARTRWLWLVNGLFTFSVPYGIVYWAEQWIPSGLAAVLFSTFPLFVAVVAHRLLPGERLTRLSLAGIVIGLFGVVVIFSDDLAALGGRQTFLASLVFLVSPAVSATANVVIKRWGSGIHPLSLTSVPMALTAVVMGGLSLVFERPSAMRLDAASVGALFYLAVMGSAVTFSIYFWLLARLSATRLSLITYAIPIVAVLVGSVFLGEAFTPRMAAGTALVLGGAALALRRRRPAGLVADRVVP